MTNSTTDSETPPPISNIAKTISIRFEAIVPLCLMAIIAALYGRLLMDANLRTTLEWTATRIYGAEINIARIKTSVFNASFLLEGLEITDKEKPTQNLVKIGSIKFEFLWDALLRAKFVVVDSGIFDIKVYSPRKTPGIILPKDATSYLALQKLEDGILDQGKEEFNGNALGDIAAILGGADPTSQIDSIKDSLKSEQKIDDISASIDVKEKEWKKRLGSIGKTDKLKKIKKAVKAINFKKNPIKALKQYNTAIKDVKQTVKEYTDATNEIQRNIKEFKNNFNDIDTLLKSDVAALKGRFKIPEINVADFSKNLFGNMFKSKVASFKKYSSIAKEYMPPSKEDKAKTKGSQDEGKSMALVPHKRDNGKDYKFPVTTGYPLFWLKRAGISSKDDGSAFSGDLLGEITNFSTDPQIIKTPTKINFAGDFKGQSIHGIDVNIIIDNLSQVGKTVLDGQVRSFPVSGMEFSKSESINFGINKAVGHTKIHGEMLGDKMIVKVKSEFTKIDYQLEAKNSNVDEILTNVVTGISIITLRASATGHSDNLNWNIKSNLGQEISKGIKGQVQDKINQAEAKIQKLVNDKIGNKRKALEQKYSKLKGQLDKLLGDKKKNIANSKNQILSDVKNKQKANSPKKKVEKKARNLIKNLGKKIKLPF